MTTASEFRKSIEQTEYDYAVAILAGYNEQDIVESSIRYALTQGLHVFYIDDHSTDSTRQVILSNFSNDSRVGYCLLPQEYREECSNGQTWNLRKQLSYKTHLAKTQLKRYEWIVHMDCDELFTCSWATTVLGGLKVLPKDVGIVFCHVLDYFPSTDDQYEWAFGSDLCQNIDDCLRVYRQRNNQNAYLRFLRNSEQIDLGIGHDATTEPKKMFRWAMTMHHFPYRNSARAQQKVKEERIPRISIQDKQKGYGYHYSLLNKLELPVDAAKNCDLDYKRYCTKYKTRATCLFRPQNPGTFCFEAYYGGFYPQNCIVVTQKALEQFLVEGNLKICSEANFNELFGDVWPTMAKTLTVVDRNQQVYCFEEVRNIDICISLPQ